MRTIRKTLLVGKEERGNGRREGGLGRGGGTIKGTAKKESKRQGKLPLETDAHRGH